MCAKRWNHRLRFTLQRADGCFRSFRTTCLAGAAPFAAPITSSAAGCHKSWRPRPLPQRPIFRVSRCSCQDGAGWHSTGEDYGLKDLFQPSLHPCRTWHGASELLLSAQFCLHFRKQLLMQERVKEPFVKGCLCISRVCERTTKFEISYQISQLN